MQVFARLSDMYSVKYENRKVIGSDDNGEETLLLDVSDVYKNMGRIPLRTLDKDESGRVKVREIIWEELSGRYRKNQDILSSDIDACAFLVMDCLMAGKMMSDPKPVFAAIADGGQEVSDILSNSISWFNPDNVLLRMGSEMEYRHLKEKGFDIVVIFADDEKAEKELRLAEYLLKEDGLLIMAARRTRLFENAAELFISDLKKIRIDPETLILTAKGGDSFRTWFSEKDRGREYEEICREAEEILKAAGGSPDEKFKKEKELVRRINRLIKEARKDWDLEKKQELTDLKEKLCGDMAVRNCI